MSRFSERKKAYQMALEPVNRPSGRILTELPGNSKIYLCGSPSKLVGKYVVYKLQLGETNDFGIVSSKTPFSRSISLGYCSSTIKMYGGKGYLKPLCAFPDEKSARTFATDLRTDLEVSMHKNFRRL